MVTIDASVLVAAGSPNDPARDDSQRFLRAVLTAGLTIHQPTLTLVEVSAAMARRSGDRRLAREAGLRLLQMPGFAPHALDVESAAEAAGIASQAMLRGADAIYAATARRHGTTLVTLDQELLTRSAGVVDSLTPAEWLARTPA
jgi:predicted nucleic acid-binding protein